MQTPAGEEIVFKRDTGVCWGMPYSDLHEHMEGNIDKFMDGWGL